MVSMLLFFLNIKTTSLFKKISFLVTIHFWKKNRLSHLRLVKRRKTPKLNSKKFPSTVEVNTSFNSPSSSPRGEKRKDITKCLTLPRFQSH